MNANCPPTAHLCQMTDPMRQYIVNQINFNRNQIASGGNSNLTGALNMPKVVILQSKREKKTFIRSIFLHLNFVLQLYDLDLEKMATFKLQDCQYTTHDPCRNTC